jgi:hypothetical protein
MWGRGIREIHRSSEGKISKAHYVATMTRVKYTKDVESRNHSIQYALHNFVPGPNSIIIDNKFDLVIRGHSFSIVPVDNYGDQTSRLMRYGGNFRTSWIKTQFTDASEEHRVY